MIHTFRDKLYLVTCRSKLLGSNIPPVHEEFIDVFLRNV